MNHLVALGIKYAMVAVVIFLLWPLVGIAAPTGRLLMALWVTVLTYVIGDLVLLPSLGNVTSAVVDSLLVTAILFVGQFFSVQMDISLLGAFILGALIAVGEWFFHKFVRSAILSP